MGSSGRPVRGYTDDHRRPDSSWFNYPKAVTVENASRVYRAGEQMMVWMNAGVAVLFAGLAASIFEISVFPLFIPGMVIVLGSVVVGMVKIFRA